MIRQVLALPIVILLSALVQVVGIIGEWFRLDRMFGAFFDWLIGFERARKMRIEHGEALQPVVAKRDIDRKVSKQFLIRRTRENRQESIARVSRGESVLSVGIAAVALTITELSAPPSYLRLLLFGLTVAVIVAVLFRETAIDALAFTSESPFDTYSGLHTKRAWNGGTLQKSRVTRNLLFMVIIREWDERFYQIYLQVIADFIENAGFSTWYAIREYTPMFLEVVEDKYDFLGPQDENQVRK